MKRSYGVDTKIETDKGEYLIETYADSQQSKVVSEVFFKGKIVEVKEVGYESKISEDGLIRLIKRLQNSVIADLENLFDLDESMRKKATVEGLYKIGRLFFKRKLVDRAKNSFEECIKMDANYGDAYRDLGRIALLLVEKEKAVEYLRRANEIEPDKPDYHFYLGKVLLTLEKYEEAEKEFEKALEIDSDYAEAYFYHGLTLLKSSTSSAGKALDDSKAISIKVDLKNASVLDARFREKSFDEAFNLLENKDYSGVLKGLVDFSKNFVEIEAHDLIDEFSLFAKYSKKRISLLTVNEYINDMLALVDEHPEFADLHNALGKAYILKVRALLNASSLQFKKSLEINPDYKEAEKNLTLVENEGRGFLLLLRAILK